MKKIFYLFLALIVLSFSAPIFAQPSQLSKGATVSGEGFVAVIGMNMLILPGTLAHLEQSIAKANEEGARALIVLLDTPGGVLQTSQEMIQAIFKSPIPIIVYVSPTGSTATSAGVFITLAAHVAAMAPGTSIGAATPVAGDGKNIESDMKAKAENMTIAMVRAIAERRGRNTQWAEKAVKEAASITEKEALKLGVIDIVAEDIDELLHQLAGKKVQMEHEVLTLEDFSRLPRRTLEMSSLNAFTNIISHPNVMALLWLAATTGISIELYSPGLIVPGLVGVICLILALAVSQILPINQAAILLFVFGAGLIGAELYTGTLLLGIFGLVSLVLGALYLFDSSQAPGLGVSYGLIVPVAVVFGSFMLLVSATAYKVLRKKSVSGTEGMIGLRGKATENISHQGKAFINSEHWKACTAEGIIESGAEVEVVGVREGLVLEVRKV